MRHMRHLKNYIFLICIILSSLENLQASEFTVHYSVVDTLNMHCKDVYKRLENLKKGYTFTSNEEVINNLHLNISNEIVYLGDKYLESGVSSKAEECYKISINIIDSLSLVGDHIVAHAYSNLATIYEINGNTQLAFETYIKSYTKYKILANASQDTLLNNKLKEISKRIEIHLGNYNNIYTFHEINEGDDIYRDGDGVHLPILLNEIIITADIKNYCAAKVSDLGVRSSLNQSMEDDIARNFKIKGLNMINKGNFKLAKSCFQTCLDINKSLYEEGNIDIIKSLLLLKNLYSHTKEFDKEFECMNEALNQLKIMKSKSESEDRFYFDSYILYGQAVDLYLYGKKYRDGLQYAKKLYELSLKLSDNEYIKENHIYIVRQLYEFYSKIQEGSEYRGELELEIKEFQNNIVPVISSQSGNFVIVSYDDWEILSCSEILIENPGKNIVLYKAGTFYQVYFKGGEEIGHVVIGLINPQEKHQLLNEFKQLNYKDKKINTRYKILKKSKNKISITVPVTYLIQNVESLMD